MNLLPRIAMDSALVRRIALKVLASGLVLTGLPAQAQWAFEPSIAAGLTYDDNAILTTRTDVDASAEGYIGELAARILYTSSVTDVWMLPRIRTTQYSDASALDSTDGFLNFNYVRTGEAANLRFRGSVSYESVRTSERSNADLSVEDPDESPDDDSGRIGDNNQRWRTWLVPEWNYSFDPKSSIGAAFSYRNVEYEDDINAILTDFTDMEFGANYKRNWSERATGIFGAFVRQYEATETSTKTTGYGGTFGFNYSLSETTRVQARVGAESSEVPTGESFVNPVGELSIIRRLQTIRILAAYRRSVSGSGTGTLVVRDSVSLNFTRDLNERISAGIGLRAYQTNPLGDDQVDLDARNYVQLRGLFTWNLSRTFSLDVDYRYTYLDRSSLGEGANSNAVDIWLNYHPTF
jgi:hypothetical protein